MDCYQLDVNQAGSWRRCLTFAPHDLVRVQDAAAALLAVAQAKGRITVNGTPVFYFDCAGAWRQRRFGATDG